MYFKQFLDERCGCASYLVASRQSHEAAIIDPSIAIEEYDDAPRPARVPPPLRRSTPTSTPTTSPAPAASPPSTARSCVCIEAAQVAYPFRPLHDGEELALGQLRLRVLHTPGHRPELISILVINPERSPEPSMVLTGDSLLVGDVGRPDFGGGRRRRAIRESHPAAATARLGGRLPRPLRRPMRQGDVRPAEHDHRLRAPLQPPGAPGAGPVHRPPERGRARPARSTSPRSRRPTAAWPTAPGRC